ncbi:hypothetical protein QQS45_08510 [Alteriqipengyuania flavescens]|uniref:hypothetical protein n=1 Tax=Alteriqipengyuania flavescens TaxID=3053610 RepID=UPI0025B400C5|nr:hypothetical protein [Alteriqipengyuania flavescens]WJY17688.1 hypothetical protein QQW98_08505 [Alteriqipengyuania flavescens]WJY23631.1 hypothetical protein QQS45_08510 [Alteriqipengyuania flavescens]
MGQTNAAIDNAKGWLETIRAMVKAYEADEQYEGQDAIDAMLEAPLSVQVRSDWADAGKELKAEEYLILLTTGGPALRITGDLSGGYASTAALEWQDWGTPWTDLHTDTADTDALMTFAGAFYFGE